MYPPFSNDDAESTSSEEFEPPPLMVLNRSKRANAGNLMSKLLTEKEIEKKEGDEVYESLWGGFLDVSCFQGIFWNKYGADCEF